MVRTFLKVYMELDSYFLFLQEQIKDIIIIFRKVTPLFESCTPSFTYRGPVSWLRAGRVILPHGARLADPCV